MKAFNKTRQKLLADGRLKRYLLYAFGEIVLVVVGILIALQLNAWKADQKDKASEQTHFENLREDLQLQLEVIRAQMVHDSTMIRRADSAMAFFNGGMSVQELEAQLFGSYSLGWRKTFVASDATFKVLLSTGGMNLIGDHHLRTDLMRYHQRLNYTTLVVNTNNGLIDELFSLNASNSTPNFSMDVNGNIENDVAMTGQDRYRLHELIKQRRDLSRIALTVCEAQRLATAEMIDELDQAVGQ
ncbi:MAG TPA: DUF6090 family protein [Flavobacteriales bacterium]|nr:DUF6090 family protein [Flavobacteriales bacterium]HQW40218.1 DUF6090 family protein [Flavobacteriales bacterium]